MSHRPGLAARRFYRSFYKWTQLTSGTNTGLPAGRHALHMTPRGREDSGETRPLIASDSTRRPRPLTGPVRNGEAGGARRRGRQLARKIANGAPSDGRTETKDEPDISKQREIPLPKKFTASPVLSTIEKPFSSFAPREKVVRYRSQEGLMLEFAIDSILLQIVQTRYGTNLKTLAQRTGARIEVQDISAPVKDDPHDRIHSVLLSGTFYEVHTAVSCIISFGVESMLLAHRRVDSRAEMPSRFMIPWQLLLRSKDDSQVIAETSVLEKHWDSETARNMHKLALAQGVAMEAGEPEPRPINKKSRDVTAIARSLILQGPVRAVVSFHRRLIKLLGNTLRRSQLEHTLHTPRDTIATAQTPPDSAQSVYTATNATIRRIVTRVDQGGITLQRENTKHYPLVDPPSAPRRKEAKEVQHLRLDKTPEQQKQLVEEVRTSLRSLTHPVALITSRTKPGDGKRQLSHARSIRGVTVSSFNTVTLDPRPIVSFNLKVPSRSWDAMQESRRLRIHLLEASSRGAAVAQIFTKPYEKPDQAFTELRKLGLDVEIAQSNQPPIISDKDGAVLAHMEADIHLSMTFGDHVVVLAEVKMVTFGNEKHQELDGLAYAQRGYRTRGKELVPDKIPETIAGGTSDALMLEVEEPTKQSREPLVKAEERTISGDPFAEFDLDNDPIFNALRATKAAAEGEQIDVNAAMARKDDCGKQMWPADGKSAPAVRRGLGNAQTRSEDSKYSIRPLVRTGDGGSDGNLVMAAASKSEEESKHVSSNTSRSAPPLLGESATFSYRDNAAADEDTNGSADNSFNSTAAPPAKRSISTLSKTPGSRRNFSTTVGSRQKDSDHSRIVEPAAETITVADYFNVPDDNKRPHSPRVRSLVRLQREVLDAEARLSQEGEKLSEDEITALQNTIAHKERIIARKLAWNAASDLRLMLDKGNARVDFKRAQWLESAVEKGLKVLLDDARRLRKKREEGKVDKEGYEKLKVRLEGDYAVLQTELLRLRNVADEDED